MQINYKCTAPEATLPLLYEVSAGVKSIRQFLLQHLSACRFTKGIVFYFYFAFHHGRFDGKWFGK